MQYKFMTRLLIKDLTQCTYCSAIVRNTCIADIELDTSILEVFKNVTVVKGNACMYPQSQEP